MEVAQTSRVSTNDNTCLLFYLLFIVLSYLCSSLHSVQPYGATSSYDPEILAYFLMTIYVCSTCCLLDDPTCVAVYVVVNLVEPPPVMIQGYWRIFL
jgi:hypothetical protein